MTDQAKTPSTLEDLYSQPEPAEQAPTAQDKGEQQPPAATQTQQPAEKSQGTAAAATEPGQTQGQQGQPPGPEDEADDRTVPYKALKDERRKRQDLEKKFSDLERKVSNPPVQRPELPDPMVDPEGFIKHQDDQRFIERVELTRELLIDAQGQEKVDAAEAAFAEAVQHNPQLGLQLRRATNPARFAFREGTKIIEARTKPAEDPTDDIVAKVRARLEADFDLVPKAKPQGQSTAQQPPAQQQAQQQPPGRQQPALPTSLADVPSGGPRNAGARPIANRSLQELFDS